jgi:DNA gyrase subunit B
VLNNYLLQEAVNDTNLFTNEQAPAISGIALETPVKDYYEKASIIERLTEHSVKVCS